MMVCHPARYFCIISRDRNNDMHDCRSYIADWRAMFTAADDGLMAHLLLYMSSISCYGCNTLIYAPRCITIDSNIAVMHIVMTS